MQHCLKNLTTGKWTESKVKIQGSSQIQGWLGFKVYDFHSQFRKNHSATSQLVALNDISYPLWLIMNKNFKWTQFIKWRWNIGFTCPLHN